MSLKNEPASEQVFLHENNVPKDLKLRIRKYYDYSFNNPQIDLSNAELQVTLKLPCWVYGTNPSTLARTRARAHPVGETE